jgi:hypothetical protein
VRIVAVLCGIVGVAALVGAVVAGRAAIEPEPLDPSQVPLSELTWAERASAACVDSTARTRATLESQAFESGSDRAVRLYDETTALQGELLAALRELPAPPPGARETLALLAAQHERDLATAAELRRSFDADFLREEIAAYEATATKLRTRFDRLGAPGCVAYFDPASYD